MSRSERAVRQWDQLQTQIRRAWEVSPYYRRKWSALGLQDPEELRTPSDLVRLGFTTRGEIARDQAEHPPWGTLSSAPEQFVALHNSSGETARPLSWYDDGPGWTWVKGLWDSCFRSAGVRPGDRAFFAFSFAPVLWYWAGFERAQELGLLALTGGAMTPLQMVENLFALQAQVLVITPVEALALAQVASSHGFHPSRSSVQTILYAASPGNEPAATGKAIEAAWGADAICISWLTEAGLTGFECLAESGGIHLLENDYLFEVIDPVTGQPVPAGVEGELVVTPLGRGATTVFRYRTGDRVALDESPCTCGRTYRRLAGGIRGRVGPVEDLAQLQGR